MPVLDPRRTDCDCCRRTTFGVYGLMPYGGRVGLIMGALLERAEKQGPNVAAPRIPERSPVTKLQYIHEHVELQVVRPVPAVTRGE